MDAVAAATALIPMFAPVPAAGEDDSSSTAGSRMLPSTRPTRPPAERDQEAPRQRAARSPLGILTAVERLFDTGDQAPRRTTVPLEDEPLAARMRPLELGDFIGQEHLLGPGSALRTAIETGAAALDDPLRPAREREDDARADRRRRGGSGVRGGERGERRPRRGARGDRARRRSAGALPAPARSSSSTRSTASTRHSRTRCCPAVEEGLLVLIGATTENPYFEVNSALLSRSQIYELRPLEADQVAELLRRALRDPERGIADPPEVPDDVIDFLAARSGGDARAAYNALELAADTAKRLRRAGDRRAGRGRDAEEGRPLRQGGRQALRLHLGVDQVDARLRRGRLALLPRGDARGRRGPALHRAPDDRAGLRGHRQRGPAGAGGRRGGEPGRGARRHAGVRAQPQPGRRLPRAGAEVQRQHARRSPGPAPTCGARAPRIRPHTFRTRTTPAPRSWGAAWATSIRTTLPGGVSDQSLLPEGMEDRRYYEPTDRGFEEQLRERLAAVRQKQRKNGE